MNYSKARELVAEAARIANQKRPPITGFWNDRINPPKPPSKPATVGNKRASAATTATGDAILEARQTKGRSGDDRAKKIMDKWDEDLKSGKATKKMLSQIKKHHADAVKKKQEELALAGKHKDNNIRLAHHMMRAEHFGVHASNYERHYGNTKKAHDMGDYRRAAAEGSHAASGPHLRDVPHHVDYHLASYYDKK